MLENLLTFFCMKPLIDDVFKDTENETKSKENIFPNFPKQALIKTVKTEYYTQKDIQELTKFLPDKPKTKEVIKKDYTYKPMEYRPKNLSEFIGQDSAKSRISTILKKARRGMKCHIFLDGLQGSGKTSYAEMFAHILGANIIKRIGKQVNEENFSSLVDEINNSTNEYTVLFLDEVDTADTEIIKMLNPLVESFEYQGKQIKPFIFICATINKYKLQENNPDMLNRIQEHIKFERYTSDNIEQIIRQYKSKLYDNDNVTDNMYKSISNNCKYNPRIAIGLLESCIVEQNINKVLKSNNIIISGLTNVDIKLLRCLNESEKPLGVNNLALSCGITDKEYTKIYEGYLLEFGYIKRVSRGRIITELGKELLGGLEVIK